MERKPGLSCFGIALSLLLCVAVCSRALATAPQTIGEAGAEYIATFSVCAYDPSTGEVGVAVQSRFFAVGTVVPWAKAGVGAVASQAFGNPNYGPRGLELMSEGLPPSVFLPELLSNDGYASQRQIGMVMVGQPPFAAGPPPAPDAEPETATEENMTSEELIDDQNANERSMPENFPPEIRRIFDKNAAGLPVSLAEQSDLDAYLLGVRPSHDVLVNGGKQLTVTYGGGGEAITYTGEKCLDWAGGHCGITPDGIFYSVQGNILTGQDVADAMATAMEQGAALSEEQIAAYCAPYTTDQAATLRLALGVDDLPGRLLRTLVAGESKGGDSRGMQSAALLVCQAGAGYGGYSDRKYDLRVDDAANPFVELARLLNLARPIAMGNEAYNKLNSGDTEAAVALFAQIVKVNPDDANAHYNLACGYSRTGHADEALAELAIAIKLDPKLRTAAVGDTDLTPLHEREEFKALTAEPGK